jgi:hypothetical protein
MSCPGRNHVFLKRPCCAWVVICLFAPPRFPGPPTVMSKNSPTLSQALCQSRAAGSGETQRHRRPTRASRAGASECKTQQPADSTTCSNLRPAQLSLDDMFFPWPFCRATGPVATFRIVGRDCPNPMRVSRHWCSVRCLSASGPADRPLPLGRGLVGHGSPTAPPSP